MIPPLIEALAAPHERVRSAAQTSLQRLAGPGLPSGEGPAGRAGWRALFGERGERFDPGKALRPENLAPGLYQLGP